LLPTLGFGTLIRTLSAKQERLLKMNKPLVSLVLFIILGAIGCSTTEKKNTETAESLYQRAETLAKDGRIEEAIAKFQEVKNKFPYSKLATEAELAAADVSYQDESFAEAQASYQLFRDLHPKHAKTPFVIYRLGMSIYKQIPESIDRDLSLAQSGIDTFEELINQFPDSEHVAEAKEKRLDCLRKLAEKELYIANFYLKKKRWESALGRIQGVVKDHKGLGFDERALALAAFAAEQADDKVLANKYGAQLQRDFPGSKEPAEVKRIYLSR
jgi:outer membrane protein assembly factor BamD